MVWRGFILQSNIMQREPLPRAVPFMSRQHDDPSWRRLLLYQIEE